jgi:glycerophosphoryl diester phosphodiesterase
LKILGHRGIPVLYKENTLQSLLAPFSFGADGIETDVRLTKDGVPVLIHDETLTNFCGTDVGVSDLTLAELREYKSDGETVPTLEEFLKFAPKNRCLNIEIKEYEAGELSVLICRKFYEGEIIFSSFNHHLINELKEKYNGLKFGYLFDEQHASMSDEEIFALFDKNTYSAHLPVVGLLYFPERLLNIIKELKRREIKIVLWTVNDKNDIAKISEYVDYVITDDVRIFL